MMGKTAQELVAEEKQRRFLAEALTGPQKFFIAESNARWSDQVQPDERSVRDALAASGPEGKLLAASE